MKTRVDAPEYRPFDKTTITLTPWGYSTPVKRLVEVNHIGQAYGAEMLWHLMMNTRLMRPGR
jgi:hypothetical protein